MSKLIKIYLLLIIATVSTSCKNETIEENSPPKEVVEETFSEKLISKPKLFLKYWEDMSISEFYEVTAILKEENVVDYEKLIETYYITDLCRIKYISNFVDDKLKSISLVQNINCIYPLYQKKYNLPHLVKQDFVYESYIDNNTDYKPVIMYKKIGEDRLFQIPNALIDKTPQLKRRVYFDENNRYKSIGYKFYKDHFLIDNDSIIIEFTQTMTKNIYSLTTYSLSEDEDAMSAKSNINGLGFGRINNPGTGITDEIIMKNSRTVKVTNTYSLEQSITYMSKKEYAKIKDLKNSEIRKDSLQNATKKNNLKTRKEKAINEI